MHFIIDFDYENHNFILKPLAKIQLNEKIIQEPCVIKHMDQIQINCVFHQNCHIWRFLEPNQGKRTLQKDLVKSNTTFLEF